MTETIRYGLVGREDLKVGTGTFEVTLADGRVITMSALDVGAILNDSTLYTAITGLSLTSPNLITPTGSIGDLTILASTLAGLPAAGTAGKQRRLTNDIRGIWTDNGTLWRANIPLANVMDFGAVGNGATDDTAAFQSAHDALPSGGGIIYAPGAGRATTGAYLFNQTAQASQFSITKSNVAVVGDGWSTQLKKTTTGTVTGNQAIIFVRPQAATISNIRIANLRITGPTPNTGAAITGDTRVLGILIHDGTDPGGDITDVLIEGVLIENMESASFALTSGATSAIRRIKFSRCWARAGRQDGFNSFAGNVFDLTIQDSFATDLDGFGMEMGNAGGMSLIGNTVLRTGQSGIGIEYNNTISPTRRVLIANNYISDITTTAYPNASGISLGQSQDPVNTEIIGNSIFRTGGDGIILNGSPNRISIKANTIEDVGGNNVDRRGIVSGAAVTNTHIEGNTIRLIGAGYNMTFGVALAGAGSATNKVRNNEVQGATTSRVTADAPTRIVENLPGQLDRTAVGNVGAGEDDLITETIAAGALDRDLMAVRIKAWGQTGANANAKTVKLYWGSTVILSTGAIAANAKDWHLEATVLRVSSTLAEAAAHGQFNGAVVQADYQVVGGQDFTVAITVKCTGEATSNDDIIQNGLLIEFLETPS